VILAQKDSEIISSISFLPRGRAFLQHPSAVWRRFDPATQGFLEALLRFLRVKFVFPIATHGDAMTSFYEPKSHVLAKPYWERPNPQKMGDPDNERIFQAVGSALSNWERAEEALSSLFLAVTEQDNYSANPVKRAFGSIDSSSVRRKAILAAAEAYFSDDWEDKDVRLPFFKVLEAVSFASKRRDDIAHGTVSRHRVDGKPFGSFLQPPHYNTERTKAYARLDEDDPLYFLFTDFRYVSADISAFDTKFQELGAAIHYLAGFIRKLDDGSILFVRAIRGDPVLKI
jgi:hypothetical protein